MVFFSYGFCSTTEKHFNDFHFLDIFMAFSSPDALAPGLKRVPAVKVAVPALDAAPPELPGIISVAVRTVVEAQLLRVAVLVRVADAGVGQNYVGFFKSKKINQAC